MTLLRILEARTRVPMLLALLWSPHESPAQPSAARLVGRVSWTSEEGDDVTLTRPSRLTVDRLGRVFVPDGAESVVYVFGPSGQFLGKIGRRGAGPGEFNGNCCAAIDPSGRLWVRDEGAARYNVFSLSKDAGSISAHPAFTVPMAHRDVNLWSALFFDQRGNVFDVGHRLSGSPPLSSTLYRFLTDTTGRIIRSMPLPDTFSGVSAPFKATRSSGGSVSSRSYYQPFGSMLLRAHGPQGEMAIAASGNYVIDWMWANGTRKVGIKSNLKGQPLSVPEQKRAADQLREIASDLHLEVSALPFGVPKVKPVLRGLEFDAEGRLWVERVVAAGAPRESDVYGPDGSLQFVAVWPALTKMSFYGTARGRQAWVFTQDADDIPRVVKIQF